MNKLSKFFILFFLISNLTGCLFDSSKNNSIYQKWILKEVIYDDGSINILGTGNYIVITKESVTEIIAGHGNRFYKYTQDGDNLYLLPETNNVIWVLNRDGNNNLTIRTPIGLYVLQQI